jgi:hypothetical protein
MRLRILSILLALVPVAFAAGCSDTTEGIRTGTVRVRMTDSPAAVDRVDLVIDEVSIRHASVADSESGWEVLSTDSTAVNLLDLQNATFMTLAEAKVPAGTYDEVRLKLRPGSTITVDGATHPLVVPSGMTSGLKLKGPFEVRPGTTLELLIDFDAERSIVVTGTGQYMLKPVVRILSSDLAGQIRGQVSPDDVSTRVTALAGADTLQSTTTSAGSFVLGALPTGVYAVRFDPTPGWRDTTLSGVTVTAGTSVDLGTMVLTHE